MLRVGSSLGCAPKSVGPPRPQDTTCSSEVERLTQSQEARVRVTARAPQPRCHDDVELSTFRALGVNILLPCHGIYIAVVICYTAAMAYINDYCIVASA